MPKSYESWGVYISKVLATLKGDVQISSNSVSVMDDIISEFLDQLHSTMHSVMDKSKLVTVTHRVAEAATRLVLSGELGKHALVEAEKAVAKFEKTPGGTKSSKTAVSRSIRAGLNFSVGRVERALSNMHFSRISPIASVFIAAVLEYLTAEILDLASAAVKEHDVTRITPRHINLAIQSDDELSGLIKTDVIAMGGVKPMVQAALLPKVKEPKEKKACSKK